MTTKMDKRFFESTRGQIIRLMRGTTKSVNELAEELELTDNAVRAQLLSLERDGLIHQSGIQRGTRKPHFAYELTSEAEKLFLEQVPADPSGQRQHDQPRNDVEKAASQQM